MVLCQAFGNIVENFLSTQRRGEEAFKNTKEMSAAALIGLVLYMCLVLFAGRYLWDNVLCKVVTVVKPMPSLLHLLGLILLVDLLHPGSCNC
jgi:hypothetical protein